MGSRKRQDLLSKLGAWGPWERVEEEDRVRERRKKIYSSIKTTIKKNTQITDGHQKKKIKMGKYKPLTQFPVIFTCFVLCINLSHI